LYLAYHEETKDEAQQRIWTFCEAINGEWIKRVINHGKDKCQSNFYLFFSGERDPMANGKIKIQSERGLRI